MKQTLRLAGLCAALLLTACAVMDKKEMASIRARGVARDTVARLEKTEALLPRDVIELTRRGVPQEQIAHYLERTGVTYVVTSNDSVRMRNAGVGPRIIDLMARESAKFEADYAALRRDPRDSTFYDSPASGPLMLEPGARVVY